jgi:hypothetical protein
MKEVMRILLITILLLVLFAVTTGVHGLALVARYDTCRIGIEESIQCLKQVYRP